MKNGDIVEIKFLDHETQTDQSKEEVENETNVLIPTVIWGKFVKETKTYYIITPWEERDRMDVMRILKKTVISKRVIE